MVVLGSVRAESRMHNAILRGAIQPETRQSEQDSVDARRANDNHRTPEGDRQQVARITAVGGDEINPLVQGHAKADAEQDDARIESQCRSAEKRERNSAGSDEEQPG